MASEERNADALVEVARRLAEAAPRAGFFPLVAFLERLTARLQAQARLQGDASDSRAQADARSTNVRVGGAGPVNEELIRFRHDPSLGFPSGDVTSVTLHRVPVRADEPYARRPLFEVVTSFLGLTGSVSPLPHYLAEEVAQEDPDQPVRREFLDLFHHRLLSLLYRIESKYRLSSETNTSFTDQWSKRLLALGGFDTYERPLESKLPTWRLLRIVPLLAGRFRTAEQLEVALQDVMGEDLEGARVTVRQFVGRWVDIDARVQLGRLNNVLGRNMLLGGKAFDRTGKIQIHVSPLPPRAYRRLMPEGDLLPLVREVVALFVRDPLEYDLELGLTEGVQQQFRLSRQEPSKLGRDTWLGNSQQTHLSVPVAR